MIKYVTSVVSYLMKEGTEYSVKCTNTDTDYERHPNADFF